MLLLLKLLDVVCEGVRVRNTSFSMCHQVLSVCSGELTIPQMQKNVPEPNLFRIITVLAHDLAKNYTALSNIW